MPGGDQLRPVDHDPGVRTEGADTDIQQDGCRGDGGGQGERPLPLLLHPHHRQEDGGEHIEPGFHGHGPQGPVHGIGQGQVREHPGQGVHDVEPQVAEVPGPSGAEVPFRPQAGEKGPRRQGQEQHQHREGRPQPEEPADGEPQGVGVREPALRDQVPADEEEHAHAQLMEGEPPEEGRLAPQDQPHVAGEDEHRGGEADEGEVVLPSPGGM